jgi:hypothetical protein
MIKKFENFNQEKEVTLELCEELIFYTSAGLYYLNDAEYKLFRFDDLLFYNSEYSEMKKAAKKLFNLSKDDDKVKEGILSMWDKFITRHPKLIRFYELEDLFLNEIDSDFSFYLRSENGKLFIKIQKTDTNDYSKFTTYTSDIVKQNEKRGLKLSESQYYNLDSGESIWSIHFYIKL